VLDIRNRSLGYRTRSSTTFRTATSTTHGRDRLPEPCRPEALRPGECDHQWRDELRTADIPHSGNAYRCRRIRSASISFSIRILGAQSTAHHHVQLQPFGRYVLPRNVGAALNFRYQSGFAYSRIIPDGELPNLSPALLRRASGTESNPTRRVVESSGDKSFAIGKSKLTLIFDLDNASTRTR